MKWALPISLSVHLSLTNLMCNGRTGTSTFGTVDNISMSYPGDQLIKTDDTGTNITLSASMNFKNNSTAAKEYFYDLNGNLARDLNKGITSITHNLLNLPQTVTKLFIRRDRQQIRRRMPPTVVNCRRYNNGAARTASERITLAM